MRGQILNRSRPSPTKLARPFSIAFVREFAKQGPQHKINKAPREIFDQQACNAILHGSSREFARSGSKGCLALASPRSPRSHKMTPYGKGLGRIPERAMGSKRASHRKCFTHLCLVGGQLMATLVVCFIAVLAPAGPRNPDGTVWPHMTQVAPACPKQPHMAPGSPHCPR